MSRLPGYECLSEECDDNKVWGHTELIFESDKYSKHILHINPNTYCSLHYHRNRANEIRVNSGRLEIVICYGPTIESHILTSGNKIIIPSLVPHLFFAHERTSATEEYFPDRNATNIDESDIIRIIPGGKDTREGLQLILGGIFRNAI